jgi:hypothetical protein
MNLSRAAKKFRDQLEPEAPKRAKARKKAETPPAPAPVVQTPEPVPAPELVILQPEHTPEPVVPVATVEPFPPKQVWPAKTKRPRFVRAKAEKRERTVVLPLQLGSTKPAARLLTSNLALPPKDAPKWGRF